MNEQFKDKVMESVIKDDNSLFNWHLASEFAVESDIANNSLKNGKE